MRLGSGNGVERCSRKDSPSLFPQLGHKLRSLLPLTVQPAAWEFLGGTVLECVLDGHIVKPWDPGSNKRALPSP